MSLSSFRLVLVSWVIVAIVPGFVVALTWRFESDANVPGQVFLVWIAGYLVQLGLFMAASRRSGKTNVLGWIAASLLPWACDWTTAAAPWAAAPCAVVAVLVAWSIYRSTAGSEKLAQTGVPATGTVLEVEVVKPRLMNVVINNVYIRRTLRLRVVRDDGVAPYEAALKGTFMLGEMPNVGDEISLRVDAKNPQRLESVGDAAPTPTSEPRGDAPGAGNVTEQLERLAQLRASGGLTDDEFAQAKARVLGT